MKSELKLVVTISLVVFMATVLLTWLIAWKPIPTSVSIVEDGITLTISLQKTEFRLGENIDVSLTLTNNRYENVTFGFSSSYQYDFIIYDKNFEEVCAWSDNKVFAQALTSITLEPGKSRTWIWNWDQTVYDRHTGDYSPINPGPYYLQGSLVGHMTTPLLKLVII